MTPHAETKWFDLDIGPPQHGALLSANGSDAETGDLQLVQVERVGNWCCGCCGCFAGCCGTRQRSDVDGRLRAPWMGGFGRMAIVGAVLFLCAIVAIVLFVLLVLSLDGFEVDVVSEQSSGSGDF